MQLVEHLGVPPAVLLPTTGHQPSLQGTIFTSVLCPATCPPSLACHTHWDESEVKGVPTAAGHEQICSHV